MNAIELTILDFIQTHLHCAFLDFVMPLITHFAEAGIGWIAIGVILLFWKKHRRTGIMVLLSLVMGLIFGNLFLKNVVGRIRPYDLNPNVELLVEALSDFSFPSGHTLASFEAATVLLIRNKKMGIAAMVLATLIAFSRLYLYVHYPSDVLASILLGVAFAFISVYAVNKICNKHKLKI